MTENEDRQAFVRESPVKHKPAKSQGAEPPRSSVKDTPTRLMSQTTAIILTWNVIGVDSGKEADKAIT